jgi:hypothetical protein
MDIQFLLLKYPNHFCPQSGYPSYVLPVGLIRSIIFPEHKPFVYILIHHLLNMLCMFLLIVMYVPFCVFCLIVLFCVLFV